MHVPNYEYKNFATAYIEAADEEIQIKPVVKPGVL